MTYADCRRRRPVTTTTRSSSDCAPRCDSKRSVRCKSNVPVPVACGCCDAVSWRPWRWCCKHVGPIVHRAATACVNQRSVRARSLRRVFEQSSRCCLAAGTRRLCKVLSDSLAWHKRHGLVAVRWRPWRRCWSVVYCRGRVPWHPPPTRFCSRGVRWRQWRRCWSVLVEVNPKP